MATVQIYEKMEKEIASWMHLCFFLIMTAMSFLNKVLSVCSLPLHSSSPARNNGARCLEVIPAALLAREEELGDTLLASLVRDKL